MPEDSLGDGRKRPAPYVATVLALSLGWLLLYSARTALSSAMKDIGEYWGLSESYLGFLASSFFISYTILQVPSGILADKFGSRRMIVLGFAVQAVGLIFGARARSPVEFLLARLLSGAGQATYFACQQAIVSFVLPPEKRSTGTAVTVAGAGLGSACGFLLGKFLSGGTTGWRAPFFSLGVVSAIYILVVLAFVPEPKRVPEPDRVPGPEKAAGPEKVLHLKKVSGPGSAAVPAIGHEGTRDFWAPLLYLSLAHFLSMYGFYVMLTWIPYYLESVRGLTGKLAAVVPGAMPLIMAPATVIWGIAADKRGSRDFVVRMSLPVAALSTCAIPLLRGPALIGAALALYGATGKLVIDPALVSTIAENYPAEMRAATLAAFNFAGALAMVAAPYATGFIADSTGSFDPSFYAAGAFNLAALAAYVQAIRMVARGRAARGAAV